MPGKAQWSIKRTEMRSDVLSEGQARILIPLYDDGQKVLELAIFVTAEREVSLVVTGEPGQILNGFTARSNI